MRHGLIVLGTLFLLSGCFAGADSDDEAESEFAQMMRVVNDEPQSLELLSEDSDYELVSVGSPEHGQLEVDGRVITYTPSPGFAGVDALTYRVVLDDKQQQINLNIDVVQEVTIAGRVFDQPIPYARVTTEYAGELLETEADAQGFYEFTFDIQDLELDDTLIIKARGVSRVAQEDVSLQTIIVPPARLLSLMNDERRVTREQLNDVQITQLSTAYSVMVLRGIASASTLSQEEVDQRSQQLDPDQLIHMAGVIKLLVDDSAFRLPSGYGHVLQLLQSESGYQNYLNTLLQNGEPGDDLTRAITHTLRDDQVMPQFASDDWAASYVLTQPVHADYTPMHAKQGWRFIELGDAGDGRASSEGDSAHRLQWQSNASGVQVNLIHPREQEFEISVREAFDHMPNRAELWRLWGNMDRPVTVTLAIDELELMPLRQQSSVFAPVVALESGYFKAFQFTARGQQHQVDARPYAGSRSTYLMSDRSLLSARPDYFAEHGIVGSWALGQTAAGGQQGLGEADIFRFYQNGSFSSEFQQLSGDWQLNEDDGRLTLEFAEGPTEIWQVSFAAENMASALVRTEENEQLSEELRVLLPITPGSISPRLFINSSSQQLQVVASDFLNPGFYNAQGELQAHPDWRGYQITDDNRGFAVSFTCGEQLSLYRPWCQNNFRHQNEAPMSWTQESDEMAMRLEDFSDLCVAGDCLEQRWKPLVDSEDSFVVLAWQRVLVEIEDDQENLQADWNNGWNMLTRPQIQVITPRPLAGR
ncbi:hypothetical protein CWE09_11970 [Aliidiomarina minuta]|uniref:Uncharacterized protein n=1 Tax=Aliidiomarina minuta TaxID=880057 RepID=A0A432W3D4_9GAMM|nr:Ig-like domain-containing protein [Aliidiomarina minuta]RUO23863.1 hypothetical protein CWE09_11970 [Aliidiomarina minuta]